jgi:hypothetical protein
VNAGKRKEEDEKETKKREEEEREMSKITPKQYQSQILDFQQVETWVSAIISIGIVFASAVLFQAHISYDALALFSVIATVVMVFLYTLFGYSSKALDCRMLLCVWAAWIAYASQLSHHHTHQTPPIDGVHDYGRGTLVFSFFPFFLLTR